MLHAAAKYQLGKKAELDRLWLWTKTYMMNKAGDHKGRCASTITQDCLVVDYTCRLLLCQREMLTSDSSPLSSHHAAIRIDDQRVLVYAHRALGLEAGDGRHHPGPYARSGC